MPKYYEEEEPDAKPKLACGGLREDLLTCLLKSDCVRKLGNSPKECLLMKGRVDSVPDECYALRIAFFECKRSLLDMRQRFRGRKGY